LLIKIALNLLLFTRGIPVLFYGTEIGISGGKSHGELRQPFPGGFAGDKRSAFTREGRGEIENEIFNLKNKNETINEILRIKTNIVNFRKAMNRHTHVIQKFLNKAPRFFAPEKTDKLNLYFKDLAERSEDLWQMLESYQDTIDAIHESHLSLINHHSNIIMQVFTIFTTVIFSVELVISWVSFDLDTLSFTNNPAGFFVANAGLLLVILMMVIFFKKRNWI